MRGAAETEIAFLREQLVQQTTAADRQAATHTAGLAAAVQEARNAAVHFAGNPLRMTLAQLTDNALRTELKRLKDQFNNGADFPERTDDLQGGRPIAA